MFQLSSDPKLQRIQLDDLLKKSIHYLQLLTGPIEYKQSVEPVITPYGKNKLQCDYIPPVTRYAKFGNTRATSLDFE